MIYTFRIALISLGEKFSDRFYATIQVTRLLSWHITTPRPFPLFGSASTTTGSTLSSGLYLTSNRKKHLCLRGGHSAFRYVFMRIDCEHHSNISSFEIDTNHRNIAETTFTVVKKVWRNTSSKEVSKSSEGNQTQTDSV